MSSFLPHPSSGVRAAFDRGDTRSSVVTRLRAAGCVYAEDETELLLDAARSAAELERMVARREAGEPLEYVVGWAGFCGLRVAVAPGVFVPRRRTEYLARRAARLLPPAGTAVDLCCGTGAIAAVLLTAVPDATVVAADVDPAAVACARRNLGERAAVYAGDLFDALPQGIRGRVDVLVANTPYVPTAEIALMPAEARLYEAAVSLDGGEDGLDLQRRVAADAALWLAPGGHLLVEASARQASTVASIFLAGGLLPRVLTSKKRAATVVVGTRPLA